MHVLVSLLVCRCCRVVCLAGCACVCVCVLCQTLRQTCVIRGRHQHMVYYNIFHGDQCIRLRVRVLHFVSVLFCVFFCGNRDDVGCWFGLVSVGCRQVILKVPSSS